MILEQKLNEFPVVLRITGHSNINGAFIPEGSTVEITSNDPTVATTPSPVEVPAGGIQLIDVAVTQIATGSTDFHTTVTSPDGTVYESTSTLILNPVVPGLINIETELVQMTQP